MKIIDRYRVLAEGRSPAVVTDTDLFADRLLLRGAGVSSYIPRTFWTTSEV